MRHFTIGISLLALLISVATPAIAKEGVPGRRVGGGTRWTAPRSNPGATLHTKLSAMAFASRSRQRSTV